MKVLHSWTDDHLPCFSFEHEGRYYAISWTDAALKGRLELVEEGTISVKSALKALPGLLRLVTAADPFSPDTIEQDDKCEIEDDPEDGLVSYQTDAGFVQVMRDEAVYKRQNF